MHYKIEPLRNSLSGNLDIAFRSPELGSLQPQLRSQIICGSLNCASFKCADNGSPAKNQNLSTLGGQTPASYPMKRLR
jgi:hypothetical protein